MSSRYRLTSPPDTIRAYFEYTNHHDFPPRINIAPTEPVAIVRTSLAGAREIALVRWGLIPPWVKDPGAFSTLFNARAETLADKASFKGALRHKRCLVPADGFYDWTGPKGAKVPHLISPRSGGPMAMAGLYEQWMGADGSEIDTMAIITVPANRTVGVLHDRMPAIVPRDQFDAWLDCRGTSAVEALDLLRPAADDLLNIVKLNRGINDAGPQT